MKTILQFLTVLLITVSLNAQETIVNLSMQPSYANQVYYKLSTETETSFAANSWDIAFLRTSSMNFSIRANDGIGIQVFDVSNEPTDWNTVDVSNQSSWTELHNDETSWQTGAFDQGSADGTYAYGWGNYNLVTHVIEGDVIFVLKYNDGTYRKFFINSYAAGYSFKYATWDAITSTWSADQTATVVNSSNPTNKYNYYSLQNNTQVVAEPAIADWDFVFTKYAADYYGDGSLYYPVTGVLHSDAVTVAQNEETSGIPTNSSLTYSDEINVMGYDWKTFNMSNSTYDIASEQAYYIKYADDTVYRLYFTSFSGASSGNISFNFENVTASLGIENVNNTVSFGVYPNPSTDKTINLIYDVTTLSADKNDIAIYSISGAKVFETTLKNTSGFYNKQLNLSHLQSGMYVLQFTSGGHTISKKLILN